MDSPNNLIGIETVRVHEIMIPVDQYPKVLTDCSLRDAMTFMDEAQLDVNGRKTLPRALLVFDRNGVFRGCIRRRDIMGGLEPKFLVSEPIHYRMKLFDVNLDPNLSALANKHVVKGIQEQANRPVSDVMRPIEASLKPDDLLMTAMYEMVVYELNLIPVMEKRKVIGVVRSVELFHELAKQVL
ncbi:MAG: CBS domain-containing protein [Proteobacteria bacterium]|nr:CBS domain-containing protein [Pseudomonadota bacterium]